MQKRDFYTKKNNDPYLYFFYSPLKEFLWWSIFFFKNLFFHFSPKIFINIRNFILRRTNSFARDRSSVVSGYYANCSKSFYEIQIKNTTRTTNIFEEGEKVTFNPEENKDYFLFGIAPLIETYNLKKIKEWTLKIEIQDSSKTINEIDIEFPLGEGNSSDKFVYRANEGWIDLKLNISKYKNKKISIVIWVELKKDKKRYFKEKFSLSNPFFINKKDNYKNIILLSIESLTDLRYMSKKYSLPVLSNFEKLMNMSSTYKDAYTANDSTLAYSGSIFSGLMPSQHGIGDYSASPDNFNNEIINNDIALMSEQLKLKGFLNFFGGTAPRLNSKNGFARGFDSYFQVNKNYFLNRPKINSIINGIDSYKGFDKFFFLHLDCLHEPSISFLDDQKPLAHDIDFLDKDNPKFNVDAYIKGLEEIDNELGYLIDYLNCKSEMDKTLILLTGDHGNGLNWKKGAEYSLYDERVRVPLVVKYPEWVTDKKTDLNKPVSSVFEIHKIIKSALKIEVSEEFMNLPQYSKDYVDYVFSEVIMMPNKDRNRQSLSIIYNDFKYVCFNEIDWKKFKVKNRLSDRLYKKDITSGFFNEKIDISENNQVDFINLRNIGYKVIDANLNFHKKYPADRY